MGRRLAACSPLTLDAPPNPGDPRAMKSTLLGGLIATGCQASPTREPPDRWKLEERLPHAPQTAWDPLKFEASATRQEWLGVDVETGELLWGSSSNPDVDPTKLIPRVHDPDGVEVEIEPLDSAEVPSSWRATAGWQPGVTYTATAALRETAVLAVAADDPQSFEVEDFGRNDDFDGSATVGRVFAVDRKPSGGHGVEDLLWAMVDLRLSVLALDGEDLDFRLWAIHEGQPCEVLRSTGTLSASGELNWSSPYLEANSTPGPLQLWDLALQLGFNQSGTDVAGLHLAGMVDVRPLDATLDDSNNSVCDEVRGFGMACQPCPDDGDVACLSSSLWWGTMVLSAEEDPGDLEVCESAIEEGSVGCGCASGPSRWRGWEALLLVGLATFGARRRRAVPRQPQCRHWPRCPAGDPLV